MLHSDPGGGAGISSVVPSAVAVQALVSIFTSERLPGPKA